MFLPLALEVSFTHYPNRPKPAECRLGIIV